MEANSKTAKMDEVDDDDDNEPLLSSKRPSWSAPPPPPPTFISNNTANTTIIGSQTTNNFNFNFSFTMSSVSAGSSASSTSSSSASVPPPPSSTPHPLRPFASSSSSSMANATAASSVGSSKSDKDEKQEKREDRKQPSSSLSMDNSEGVGSASSEWFYTPSQRAIAAYNAELHPPTSIVEHNLPRRFRLRERSNQLYTTRLIGYAEDLLFGSAELLQKLAAHMFTPVSVTCHTVARLSKDKGKTKHRREIGSAGLSYNPKPNFYDYIAEKACIGLEDLALCTQDFPLPTFDYYNYQEQRNAERESFIGHFISRLNPGCNNAALQYLAVQCLVYSRSGIVAARDDAVKEYSQSHKRQYDRGRWTRSDLNEMTHSSVLTDALLMNVRRRSVVLKNRPATFFASAIPSQKTVDLAWENELYQVKTPPSTYGPWLITPWESEDDIRQLVARILLSPASYSVPALFILGGDKKGAQCGRVWLIGEKCEEVDAFSVREVLKLDIVFIDMWSLRMLYESVLKQVFALKEKESNPNRIRMYDFVDLPVPKLRDLALHFTASWYSWFGSYLRYLFEQHFMKSWGREKDIIEFARNPNWMTKFNHFHIISLPIILCMATGMGEDDFQHPDYVTLPESSSSSSSSAASAAK